MRDINGVKLFHGAKITCRIDGRMIWDAKVSMKDPKHIHICQNIANGAYVSDKLGYKYSWFLDNEVTDLEVVNKDYEIF